MTVGRPLTSGRWCSAHARPRKEQAAWPPPGAVGWCDCPAQAGGLSPPRLQTSAGGRAVLAGVRVRPARTGTPQVLPAPVDSRAQVPARDRRRVRSRSSGRWWTTWRHPRQTRATWDRGEDAAGHVGAFPERIVRVAGGTIDRPALSADRVRLLLRLCGAQVSAELGVDELERV